MLFSSSPFIQVKRPLGATAPVFCLKFLGIDRQGYPSLLDSILLTISEQEQTSHLQMEHLLL